jgi:hypothetical protein
MTPDGRGAPDEFSPDHSGLLPAVALLVCSFSSQKDAGRVFRLAHKQPHSPDVPQRQKTRGFDKYAKHSL